MYWIVDDFVNPERPMYIYKSGNNISATSSIGKAFKIEDETKATNIMNSLPKVLRKNHAWEVRKCSNDECNEIGDNFEGIESVSFESYENILSKTKTTTTQMSALLYSQKQALKSHVVEYQTLLKMLSDIDKQLSDIDHFIEFNKFSASRGYKMLAMRQEKLKQRREIKDSIFIYQQFLSITDQSKINNAISSIEGLGGREYAPRTNLYEELKYI